MTKIEFWDCDRCGNNSKDNHNIDIFTIRATPVVQAQGEQRPLLTTDFELCQKCFREILSDWGRNFLE